MKLSRLLLRNYRVYDDLELELPPGLIGIYGPNGAGKSSLVESIRFCLYGRARTANDEVRTSGVNADCVAEVEFEHEGHLYLVRRTISGVNSTVKAKAHADGLQVAEGVRDTARYVRSILGMDDAAFRASVFAEQKQLAAFSGQTTAERRKLVLQLLGINSVDGARDQARKDGREAMQQHENARGLLPELEPLKAEVAATEAAAKTASNAEQAAARASADVDEAVKATRQAHEQLVVTGREYERIVAEGKAVRDQHATAEKRLAELDAELKGLITAAERLAKLEPEAEGLAGAEQRLTAVQAVAKGQAALAEVVLPEEPPRPDEEACEAGRAAADQAGRELGEVEGQIKAAADELARARQQVERAGVLSDEADCPLCGQALGTAFEQVQHHRAEELARAELAVERLTAEQRRVAKAAKTAAAQAAKLARDLKAVQQAWSSYEKALERRQAAERTLAEAVAGVSPPPGPGEAETLSVEVERRRAARDECQLLRGRLQRRESAQRELDAETERLGDLKGRLDALREKVAALAFEPEQLAAAATRLQTTETAAEGARRAAQTASNESVRARTRAEQTAARLADAVERHQRLEELADDARHLARLGELLNAFRNALVGTVGPRLSAQAADLFAELTDHEYDLLEVDPESYDIKIHDAGRVYGMDRFSGSETDLANLALRVAISEHVRFQSGGSVGLLVLDEVFGPLDADRKERMLLALERLRARFRQVLVVTHDNEIKEQLPSAIEVVKLPGRRATARLLGV